MASITESIFVAAYEAAKARELGHQTDAEGKRALISEHGMNASSANDYLDAYRHMRKGEVFKRTISVHAVEYYLRRIRTDFGVGGGALALRSLERHIDYYEPVRGSRCVALRAVAERFRSEPQSPPVELAQLAANLEADVAVSLKLSPSARRDRLPKPGHKPKSATVTTTVFVRSPAVIAEVLLRANGRCEKCRQPAPFRRKMDNSPYLEIHHKQRLADGGDDTVENAEALCPNCHREFHFGNLARASLTPGESAQD